MSPVEITLLGGFGALVDGRPVDERAWRLKKARELVKLLAVAPGHRLHRDQAMDVLWRDRGASAARNNLYQATHAARRVLGADAIELRDELLTLVAEVDADRFERAVLDARQAASPAAYRAALSLYGGELLPENRYDDWAGERRETLVELHEELVAALAADEGRPTLRGLPADASSFVGRARELRQLRILLGRTRLLTLTGTGGTGKTRLALELGRGAEGGYEDGVALVELATATDPTLVEHAVAAALDVRPLPGHSVADALVEFLARRTVLLVVDNCEHVLPVTAALVDRLLRGAEGLTVLATSREQLRVAGEVVYRVPSLSIPDPERRPPVAALAEVEAVRLFVDRAAAASPGFELDDDNAEHVARICFRLDGLPLALELAAGRLGALSAASIAERLDDRFRLLRAGSHAAPTRQQTLAATLQWSHDLLEPDERALFRRLGAFAGGFDLDAVEQVCGGGGVEAADVPDVLARLVEKSLVAPEGSFGEGRFGLLETVGLYARERLEESGESAAIARRQAGWALGLAEREQGSLRLEREVANLRAAFETLVAVEPRDALRLCTALAPFWLRRINLEEANRRFAVALAAAPERSALRAEALLAAAGLDVRSAFVSRGRERAEESLSIATEIADVRAECTALLFLGTWTTAYDLPENAVDQLGRALELAHREGFGALEALAVYTLGYARWINGDAEAAALVTRSRELFESLGDTEERATAPINVVEMRNDGPGVPLALVLEETLQPFVDVPCATAAAYVLVNEAAIARAHGAVDSARALLEESYRRFAADGDDSGRAHVLARRGYLELTQNAVETARDCLEQALELRRAQNDRRSTGLALTGLGLVAIAAGDRNAAAQRLAEARELFLRAGDRWGVTNVVLRTADLALVEERFDDAEAALGQVLDLLGEPQIRRWIGHTTMAVADVAAARGDRERAESLLRETDAIYGEIRNEPGHAAVRARLSLLAKPTQRARKDPGDTTSPVTTTKRRKR